MDTRQTGQRARHQRLERLSEELVRRMRPICPTMPEELFLEMVEQMAAVQLKYELRDEPATPA